MNVIVSLYVLVAWKINELICSLRNHPYPKVRTMWRMRYPDNRVRVEDTCKNCLQTRSSFLGEPEPFPDTHTNMY